MDFIKTALNQIDLEEDTLYDMIYNLFLFAKIKESEENIKNNKVCTLDELRNYINELEARHEDNNI